MYQAGRSYIVAVDDTVPVNSTGGNTFASGSGDSYWGPLLEKSFAKFMGSYAELEQPNTATYALKTLTNLPGFVYPTNTTDINELWGELRQAFINKDIITARFNGSDDSNAYFTVLNMTMANPPFLYMRNPRGQKVNLNYDAQNLTNVPQNWTQPSADGNFLISLQDFLENFDLVEITKSLAQFNNVTTTKVIQSVANLAQHTFTLAANATGEYVISLDTWFHGLYPTGALNSLNTIGLTVSKNGTVLRNITYVDQWASRSIEVDLQAGVSYDVQVSVNFGKVNNTNTTTVHHDFAITAQGPGSI